MLLPFHFETKRTSNKSSYPHKITSDGKSTYSQKTNEWRFSLVYETQRQIRENQADSSTHVRHGKIGSNDIGRIVRVHKYMDVLIPKKLNWVSRKKCRGRQLEKAVSHLRRRIMRLQNEGDRLLHSRA
ncbi:hypothetical protein G9A89_023292 [Geosiphon pyriformis]|nr:hypothetical protein G9A89_023292 [Geosiphon pyriformis]